MLRSRCRTETENDVEYIGRALVAHSDSGSEDRVSEVVAGGDDAEERRVEFERRSQASGVGPADDRVPAIGKEKVDPRPLKRVGEPDPAMTVCFNDGPAKGETLLSRQNVVISESWAFTNTIETAKTRTTVTQSIFMGHLHHEAYSLPLGMSSWPCKGSVIFLRVPNY